MPQVLKVNPNHPQKAVICKAAEIIRRGGLVAFPTETVYGIAAGLRNTEKLDRIKKRPRGKPYTVHIAYKKDLYRFVEKLSPLARRIVREHWPGPLTLILQARTGRKLGFRMPDNKVALALIRAVGRPIAAPSANMSGRPSPVRASQVFAFAKAAAAEGRKLDLIIDGGPARYGRDSTVLDLTAEPPQVLRKGCARLRLAQVLK